MSDYVAFLSYAHRYKPWVEILQQNLEACFQAAGEPGRIFLDEIDLESGRSWVGQLQAGLSRSDQFILVATPEALASPRVAAEWQSFIAARRDWLAGGHLHVVWLVDTPLPPFLEQIHRLDFREASEQQYRRELAKLVAGLLGRTDTRVPFSPPPNLTIPFPPDPGLPPSLRRQLVDWLALPLSEKTPRLAVALCLGLKPAALESYGSWHCAASAVLVEAMGEDAPVAAALRIIETLSSAFDEEPRVQISRLAPLHDELKSLVNQGSELGLLTLWLRQVAVEHGRLVPYFERQGEMDLLERVYVQLGLHPEALHNTVGETNSDPFLGPLELREALGLDRIEHSWVTGRWVILGDPGAGKTTLLRHLSAVLAQEGGRPWVPLYDSLPRLVREGRPLLDRAVRSLRLVGQPVQGLKAVLEREADRGHLLVLLDGLDEVPQELRDDAERLLRHLENLWPRTPIVVASRPIGYRSPGSNFRELQLLPLDRERRLELLARWLGAGEPDQAAAERALSAIDTPELRELAGNPLYLTLMALLVKRGRTPERNRTALYDQVFELLLEGEYRGAKGEPLECQQTVRDTLSRVALGMTKDNRDAEPVSTLEARLYRPELDRLRRTLERVPRWRGRMRLFLEDIAERTGILGPHDGPSEDWRFWHRTFREALAAERLEAVSRIGEGWAVILARARATTAEEDLSRWAEPFALLVGRVAEPDELVRSLVRENRSLGLRALATAQNLKDETLREILELTESALQRRQVYIRVPELVGEPRRALALLDQLRRKTRDGNDLFFLDVAIQEVARRSPEDSHEAAELRARLYDHIPQPPEDLFLSVKTPLHGKVPLWREIPSGSFLMGTQKEMGTSWKSHEVTIEKAFGCSVVPVTQRQYAAFDNTKHFRLLKGVTAEEFLDHPVSGVSWYEAVAFCRWLSAAFPWARGARLPLEEEWEYFCRAGTATQFWSGDSRNDLERVGWYFANSNNRSHIVGENRANPWGLYDVHGNVWEWTLSPNTTDNQNACVSVDPAAVDVDVAIATDDGGGRVLRGGSYRDDADWLEAACRVSWNPSVENNVRGFRIILPSYQGIGFRLSKGDMKEEARK